jgi:hypothetical protein
MCQNVSAPRAFSTAPHPIPRLSDPEPDCRSGSEPKRRSGLARSAVRRIAVILPFTELTDPWDGGDLEPEARLLAALDAALAADEQASGTS